MKKISSSLLGSIFTSYYDLFSKGVIYILVFLLPIFFLPKTFNTLDFNKQALLIFCVIMALFVWTIRILISGKIIFNFSAIYIPLGIFVCVVLASSIFSLWPYGSFWGWPLATNESFLSILSLVLLFILILNIFEKKDLPRLFSAFMVSWFLAILYAILQIFGKYLFNFDFAKNPSFNSTGTIFSMVLLTASLVPLALFLMMNSKKTKRIFYISYLVVSLFFLVLINFYLSWWLLMLGSALIIIFGTLKKELFDSKWTVLPMIFMAIPLLFLIFKFQILGLPQIPPEVFLSQNTSLSIAKNVLKEKPVLGSGPGTFIYDFSKYRSPILNSTNFWNVRFDGGNSKISGLISSTGILGLVALLFFIISVAFYGIKFIFRKNKPKEASENIVQGAFSVGILSALILLTIAFFIYSSNLTLDFVYFLFAAGLIAFNFGQKREFNLKASSFPTLIVTFSFTVVFIIGLGLGILEIQRYMAEMRYLSGIKNLQSGKINPAIKNLEGAVLLSSGNQRTDLYLRQLSQVYLAKANEEAVRKDISQDNVNKNVQILISSAINSANAASSANPNNVSNWENLGSIYQTMVGIISGSEDWAVKSYEKAINLEPTNPVFPVQKGIILLRQAELLTKDQADQKNQLLTSALIQFEQALKLKPDYFLPHLELSVLYQFKNNQDEAIKEMQEAKRLTANSNQGVIFQLGLLYYRKGDYSSARKEFELATSIDPNYANALYFLGLTYDNQGLKQKAIDKFSKVLELNPNSAEIKQILDNLNAGNSALKGLVAEQQSVVPNAEQPPATPEKLQTENPIKTPAKTKGK